MRVCEFYFTPFVKYVTEGYLFIIRICDALMSCFTISVLYHQSSCAH